MKNIETHFYYIEPYVHVSAKNNKVLFFNTLNKKLLSIEDNPEVFEIFRHSKSNSMPYSFKLSKKDLEASYLTNLIDKTKEHFMSDLLPLEKGSLLPLNFYPILNFQKEKKRIKSDLYSSLGDNIANYLYEMTIYLNGIQSNCDKKFETAYKQFVSPAVFKNKNELKLPDIRNLINHASVKNLTKLNLVSNSLNVKIIDEIFKNRNSYNCEIAVLSYYKDISNSKNCLPNDILVEVFLDFPLDMHAFEKIQLEYTNAIYTFIIENSLDLSKAEQLIINKKLTNYKLKPFYNRNNYDFFKENVFFDINDIIEQELSIKDILTNSALNKNEFGKLTILNDGNVYSNTNVAKLGNINISTIKELLYKEIKSTRSWRRLRCNVLPCRNCNYSSMCPPLSSYEIVLNQNNLCNLNKISHHQ
jgi:pseudo-rSAM protein